VTAAKDEGGRMKGERMKDEGGRMNKKENLSGFPLIHPSSFILHPLLHPAAFRNATDQDLITALPAPEEPPNA
jgi:hypothetical protein